MLSALQVNSTLGNGIADFRPVPLGGDMSFMNCAVECLKYIGRSAGLNVQEANHLTMVVSVGMLQIVESDLKLVQSLSPPEVDLITMSCRGLARVAAAQVGSDGDNLTRDRKSVV